MKKYKILIYVLLGVCLSFFLQDILSKETFASDFKDNKNHKGEENNRPNFIKASEHAIQAVVHIKSKYISNEIFGYYDPFYGKRFFKQPKENIASGSAIALKKASCILI